MKKSRTTVFEGRPAAWTWIAGLVLFAAALALTDDARAQDDAATVSAEELVDLVAPIALYPDEVLGVALAASTYPLQIVQAARFLDEREADPALEPDADWDDSIIALLNYPEVVRLMNDDLDWTWALGEAVLNDQSGVLAAVQDFRNQAYAAGNLGTDDRQTVTESDGVIEISPADPEVVYIPYYEPAEVIYYSPRPVYHYYPVAYPLYYYPYPYGYRFYSGFFWGVTSAWTIGWGSHYIHLHHHSHYDHPYYRRSYYSPYYYRSGVNLTVNINHYRNVWRPRPRRGARPYDGYRARSEGVARTYDGRRYSYGGNTRTGTNVATREGGATRTGNRNTRIAGSTQTDRRQQAAGAVRPNRQADARDRQTPGTRQRTTAPVAGASGNRTRLAGARPDGANAAGSSRGGTRTGGTAPSRGIQSSRPTRQSAVRSTPRAAAPAARPAPSASTARSSIGAQRRTQAQQRAATTARSSTTRTPRIGGSAPPRVSSPTPSRSAPQRSAPARSAPTRSAPQRGSAARGGGGARAAQSSRGRSRQR